MKRITVIIATFISSVSLLFAQGVWTQKASFSGIARDGAVSFSLGRYVFIGMGTVGPSTFSQDFWRWDQSTNTWTQIPNLPGGNRTSGLAFVIGDTAYVGFGYNGSAMGDLYAYDTTSNTWRTKASFPGNPRLGPFFFVIGDKAYIGCGSPGGTPYYKDVWEYNASTNTWTQKSDWPGGARSGPVGFSIGNYGYVGCGGNDSHTIESDMWKYNPTNDTWSSIANIPYSQGLGTPLAFVIGSKAYLGTGFDGNNHYPKNFFAYDTLTGSWSSIANFPGLGRWSGAVQGAGVNGRGYIGMGMDSTGQYLNDFWEYNPNPTGLNEVTTSILSAVVYPNPNSGEFTIESSMSISKPSIVEIYNILGEKIYSKQVTMHNGQLTMNLSNEPNGLYLYKISSKDGTSIAEGKFVINK